MGGGQHKGTQDAPVADAVGDEVGDGEAPHDGLVEEEGEVDDGLLGSELKVHGKDDEAEQEAQQDEEEDVEEQGEVEREQGQRQQVVDAKAEAR